MVDKVAETTEDFVPEMTPEQRLDELENRLILLTRMFDRILDSFKLFVESNDELRDATVKLCKATNDLIEVTRKGKP
jgi:hypothetical protein